jgi:glycosyltransferase involved in cell wall biosynthesis
LKVGIVFHKNPFLPPSSIDLVRLRALATGLTGQGIPVEIVAPVEEDGRIEPMIPVRPLSVLSRPGYYDLVKTSYHFSVPLVEEYQGPLVSRIVRVVDQRLPERDDLWRHELLGCQDLIRRRARVLVLNNRENRERWRRLYGPKPPIVIIPNGCTDTLPAIGTNPYDKDERVILFLGSVAAVRMVTMLNKAAHRLAGKARVHFVGLNKAAIYGGDRNSAIDTRVVNHGAIPEEGTWSYIRYAQAGLALATGPHPFDNDISKIFSYLRGGLPVISEEPILQNALVKRFGFGKTFAYNDLDDLVSKWLALLENPPEQAEKEAVMRFMARKHSWSRRVDKYIELFRQLLPSAG